MMSFRDVSLFGVRLLLNGGLGTKIRKYYHKTSVYQTVIQVFGESQIDAITFAGYFFVAVRKFTTVCRDTVAVLHSYNTI